AALFGEQRRLASGEPHGRPTRLLPAGLSPTPRRRRDRLPLRSTTRGERAQPPDLCGRLLARGEWPRLYAGPPSERAHIDVLLIGRRVVPPVDALLPLRPRRPRTRLLPVQPRQRLSFPCVVTPRIVNAPPTEPSGRGVSFIATTG